MDEIIIVKRVTTPFLQAIPPQVSHFDAYIYAVVPRKEGLDIPNQKFGEKVRIDPCKFDWKQKTITAHIPKNINFGVDSENDLDESWLELVQAGFLALMTGCLS